MADKLMYITNDDTQNYPFCRLYSVTKYLDTQLNESNNQNSIKSPQSCKTNGKIIIKLWGLV